MSEHYTDAKGAFKTPPRKNSFKTVPTAKVSVVSSDDRKFIERDFKRDKLSYPRDKKEPGKVIIINYEFCGNPTDTRIGSRRDVNETILCLQRQGYNINVEDILMDLPREQVLDHLKEVAKSQLSDVNCLMVFFFSHGKECNILKTVDKDIRVEEIYNIFENSLKDLPKMFIFQACKGDLFTTTGGSAFDADQEQKGFIPFGTIREKIPDDMIFYFSTIEGNVSFRSHLGSWMIQELCKNIFAYAKRDDVASILTRTTKCVCRNYYSFKFNIARKQMPLMISTLKKKFYINSNKDTHLVVQTYDEQVAVLRELKNIQKKLD